MYLLKGDLNQVFHQKLYLLTECVGFSFHQEPGSLPCLRTEGEYNRALYDFWLDKPAGWWNYKEDFIRINICSEKEFQEELEEEKKQANEQNEKEMELIRLLSESPPLVDTEDLRKFEILSYAINMFMVPVQYEILTEFIDYIEQKEALENMPSVYWTLKEILNTHESQKVKNIMQQADLEGEDIVGGEF